MRGTVLLLSLLALICSQVALAGSLEFAVANYAVDENSSSFIVTVNRTGGVASSAAVTVKSIDGTAMAGDDFQNTSIVLNWTAGDATAKTVTIPIFDNNIVNAAKTFQLELINPNNDVLGAIDTASVSIEDYEEGALSLSATSYEAAENDEVAIISISRSNGTRGEVGLSIATTDGSAASVTDYETVAMELTLADGEDSKNIEIPLVNDQTAEVNKDFTIQISAITGGAVAGANTEATVTITDSDSDFTPALALITIDSDDIVQPSLVDLTKPSLLDPNETFLDTINAIPLLSETELVAEQNSAGIVSIAIGDDKFYIRPISVVRAPEDSSPAIIINDDQSGSMITAGGISIQFQPALGGLTVLQSELAAISLPELEITQTGNITVQVDQGPPPLERNAQDVLVVNNAYYNRYNLRPLGIASPSEAATESLSLLPHPLLAEEDVVALTFRDQSEMMQQILASAPFDSAEFANSLESLDSNIKNVAIQDHGIITFDFSDLPYTLFSDFLVRRVENFVPLMTGITTVGDLNGDGSDDIKMIYSSGDEQYFYVIQ